MPTSLFNWLHLTDLHYGLTGQPSLWPNVRETFFDDLAILHELCGPWQAVLFTGDLVQQGGHDEFRRLEDEVLGPLWDRLRELGSGEAVLFAVPGNHDLARPNLKDRKPTPAERFLLNPDLFADVADEFWQDPDCEYRRVIEAAFTNYTNWWRNTPFRGSVSIHDSIFPGDFSASLDLEFGQRVGIVGLNATFLQLAGGNYQGKLTWNLRQFHDACRGDGPAWVGEHDVCLLLTHQGPEWLDDHSRNAVYAEINPAGRFATHLFGHTHENVIRASRVGGGKPLRQWQGNSLFGMEKWGDPPKIDRRHGYAAGRIEFEKKAATIRHWPRKAVKDANGWRFERDTESCILEESDGGMSPESVSYTRKANRRRPRTPSSAGHPMTVAQRQALTAYIQAARDLYDIVDLANLPEDDRHLAMQRFLLRQLYVPLRVTVEAAPELELTEDALDKLEQRREQAMLQAAGRRERQEDDSGDKFSLGERLQAASSLGDPDTAPRLIILGDPGGGKTTLLRWLATAYLLRQSGDQDFAQLPDHETLPEADWYPILVRCREFDAERIAQYTLEEVLRQTLRRLELPTAQIDGLVELLRELLENGRAILLVDGLDEITEPRVRAAFCQQLETIAERFRRMPIVATSRIVGYREMRYRLGKGFEHATLADLSVEDKDAFVRRWCQTVEREPVRRQSETDKLIHAIHSSDRIERLTANPMLLTTMALVQRKVGRLPARRHMLYWEAVGVLLNWRSDVNEPLDADEALPQLEYVAWAMCDRGVQWLRRDELIALLDNVRREYPNIRPITRQSSEQFLATLEGRTSLLVEVGQTQHNGREMPVYEFRHLTFQEYLAALALVEGRYPGHDRDSSLADRVRPLAGRLVKGRNTRGDEEYEVTENWQEALRLCVASCNDRDVDESLLAILESTNRRADSQSAESQEEASDDARPRAILAALCLADEPNVSTNTAETVLVEHFVSPL